MPADDSRRTLLGAGLAGIAGLATGGYTWRRYARRHHLRFRPLEAVNESPDPATLRLTVEDDARTSRRTERLGPAGSGDGRDVRAVPGRWLTHARAYAVRIDLEGESVAVDAVTITDRLEGAGWGADCAHLTVVVTPNRELEVRVGPSERC